jgi:hypothetical protein
VVTFHAAREVLGARRNKEHHIEREEGQMFAGTRMAARKVAVARQPGIPIPASS